MSNYEVGRGRPPEHTRFKPGRSGNPKGRPRKAPRADVPSQIGRDVRAVCRMTVTMKTPDGARRLTLGEALIHRIAMDALAGKISQQKLMMQLLQEAFAENIVKNRVLRSFDEFRSAYSDGSAVDEAVAALVASLAKRSTLT